MSDDLDVISAYTTGSFQFQLISCNANEFKFDEWISIWKHAHQATGYSEYDIERRRNHTEDSSEYNLLHFPDNPAHIFNHPTDPTQPAKIFMLVPVIS